MKKILFITPYPKDVAPSQRLKFEQYYSFISESGYIIHQNAFVSDKFWKIIYEKGYSLQKIFFTIIAYLRRLKLLFVLKKYDVVYVHLWVTPFGFPIFEWILSLINKNIIYDIDDMVFLGHSSQANHFIESLKGKRKMIFLMKIAKHVITCTPKLDEFVKKYNKNTSDISSTINTSIYIPKNHFIENNEVIIGWSGSHSTSKYLKLLEPVFTALQEFNLPFKVKVIGDASFTFKNKKIKIDAQAWKLDSEVEDLKKLDIGVYPLPDEPWVYGKSGLKALQYMALGIPTVASDLGTIKRIISDNKNGFLAKNENSWTSILKQLINDIELRKNIGLAGVHVVNEQYSTLANKDLYLQIIDAVANKNNKLVL